jgi:6-phosphogluconolactonase
MKTKDSGVKKHFCLGLLIVFTIFSLGSLDTAKGASKGGYIVFVGTYTKGPSKGIYGYRVDAAGKATSLGLLGATENPSFITLDSSGHFLYAVNESPDINGVKGGGVTAFAVNRASGKLTTLNSVSTRGADPCYIALDKTGKYVLVANYTGGSVAIFPIKKNGGVGEASAFVQHTGSSVNKERQEGPHAHWIETSADNRFAFVVDLGLDQVKVYKFDAAKGTLTPNDPPFAKIEAGQGPRHLAFHPNGKFAYVTNEIGSTVTVFSYDAGKGTFVDLGQTISTLPKGFSGENSTAEIHVHPNGKFLFVSNRGHDSITVYSIDQSSGHLTLVDFFSTGGKTPRNFEIDPSGKLLFAANEESGNVVIFKIDENTGRLTPTGETLKVPSPVSLKFLPE